MLFKDLLLKALSLISICANGLVVQHEFMVELMLNSRTPERPLKTDAILKFGKVSIKNLSQIPHTRDKLITSFVLIFVILLRVTRLAITPLLLVKYIWISECICTF